MPVDTVVLLRHGETEWNRAGRTQGWAPIPLADRGREQARAARGHVADRYDVDRIVASDLVRARETADIMGEAVDAPVVHDRAWRERDFGALQGLLGEDLFDRFPEFALSEHGRAAAERVPESGESLVEMSDRVTDAWADLTAREEGTVLLVAHGGTIRLVLGHLKGIDIPTAVLEQSQGNCAVTEVRPPGTVVRENETPY